VEDADPEYIVKNSLFVFQREAQLPQLQAKIDALELQKTETKSDPELVALHRLRAELGRTEKAVRALLRSPAVLKVGLCFYFWKCQPR
jgi:hypothetical protein